MLSVSSPPIAISGNREILRDASDASCTMAIWQRRIPFDAAPIRDSLKANIRTRLAVGAMLRDLPQVLADKGGLERPDVDPLVADVAMLAELFGSALGLAEIELRLERVETDSCRKFHADYVRARLITTYVGSGTQWLTQNDAERVANGEEPQAIQSLATGDVGIFRGRLGEGTPAIHRSPPIAGTGERRLLLVLNPVEAD